MKYYAVCYLLLLQYLKSDVLFIIIINFIHSYYISLPLEFIRIILIISVDSGACIDRPARALYLYMKKTFYYYIYIYTI